MRRADTRPGHPVWRWLQGGVLLATAGFLVAAWVRPQPSLSLFWSVVVPLLPLSFLVSPLLWRGICPLATINLLGNRPGGRRLSSAVTPWSGTPAIALLFLLVPARHLVFNTRAEWLVATIIAVCLLAFALGTRFESRAGFCNLLCPVLPVERLYGQRPMLTVGASRCQTCTICTPRGCLDLAGSKAAAQVLGPRRRLRSWMLSSFGLFAISFPGFVLGYFTVRAPATTPLWHVHAHVLGYAMLSALTLGALLLAAGVAASTALPLLGVLSASLYYWFAVPVALTALGAEGPTALLVGRVAIAVFLAWWTRRALRAALPRRTPLPTVDAAER